MEFWHLSLRIIKEACELLKEGMLNEKQCRNLLTNLEQGFNSISSIIHDSHYKYNEVLEDAVHIAYKTKALIEDCCKEDLGSALLQYNNKEAFRELLMDMDCWFGTVCDILKKEHSTRDGEITKLRKLTTFYPSSIKDIDDDLLTLYNKVDCIETDLIRVSEDVQLAEYLKGRIRGLQKIRGGEMNTIVYPYDYPHPEFGTLLASFAEDAHTKVYATKWMHLDSATKTISILNQPKEVKELIFKEAGIMEGLCHPNIIKLYCCGFSEDKNNFEFVMERGKMTLSKFLEENTKLSQETKLDIILQIASSMCYMYDMTVAHRDLKLDNVIVNTMTYPKRGNEAYVHVKLLDFGVSKVKRRDTSNLIVEVDNAGTVGYMAPEVFRNNCVKELKMDALKADVFSFGMMCREILSQEKPFGRGQTCLSYNNIILSGARPKLPNDCSRELASLISSCWSTDPSKRPTFLEIHARLRMLKKTMLEDSFTNRNLEPWWTHLWNNFMGTTSHQKVSSSTTSTIEVHNKLAKPTHLVGVKKKIIELEGILQSVGAVGIIGMGGIGKSALAKALSTHINDEFEAICYIDNLKDGNCQILHMENTKNSSLQPEVYSLKMGRDILRHVCTTKKTLIILDNVGPNSQLNVLLEDNMLKKHGGCKIIATSRTWSSLQPHIPPEGKYDMTFLDEDQSLRLFSEHAFIINQHLPLYLKDITEKIVSACNGLPLSLQVIGTLLHGDLRLRKWEQTLFRLLQGSHEIGNENLWKTLQISFDDLEDDAKDMFLDISCFFCDDSYPFHIHEEELLRIFNDDVQISKRVLYNLKDRSLIKIDHFKYISIHDQLRHMGRMIADNGRSRYQNLSMATFNECNQKDSQLVQGLSFFKLECNKSDIKSLSATIIGYNNLRILIFHLVGDFKLISTLVRQTSSLRCLLIRFSNKDGAIEDQRNSVQEFWGILEQKTLTCMHVLHLNNYKFFGVFPNKSFESIQLTDLHMKNCDHVETNLSKMTKLVNLQIIKCQKVENISRNIDDLTTLQNMRFINCNKLKTLSHGLKNLALLKSLYFYGCETLKEFPWGLESLIALENLNFSKCKSLTKGPELFGNLTCLKILNMSECEALEEFPKGLESLVALEELNISSCRSLKKGPERFGNLTSLKILNMYRCEALTGFPSGLENLVALEYLNFSKCKCLKKGPKAFGNLIWLKKLLLCGCEALEEFPSGLEKLIALRELDVSNCRSFMKGFERFGKLTSLKKVNMWGCEALVEFPSELENLVALEDLNFSKCKSLKKGPERFRNLTCLRILNIYGCEALKEFPKGLEHLVALEELNISNCKSLKKGPKRFGNLTSLKIVNMYGCEALVEFPSGLENLVALEYLNFSKCKSLKKGPERFGNLMWLKKLLLYGCEALEEFPSGLEKLTALEELDISRCKNLENGPKEFGHLKGLKKLNM